MELPKLSDKVPVPGGLSHAQRHLWFALAFMLLASGCAREVVVIPRPEPAPPKHELPPMRYSIQLGAFLKLDNAVMLTQSLEREGLDAYYFRHRTGLYKVRFGDFPSEKEARTNAKGLSADGIITEYYIVSPYDYAMAQARRQGSKELREEIVDAAERFLGIPYRWGGSSADKGFDCSGLAMAVYKLNGLNLPRSSREQFRAGKAIERSELEKADLVFFATSGGRRVSHVGVYTGKGRFIHAPRRGKTIRIARLSNTYYKRRYVGARTYLR